MFGHQSEPSKIYSYGAKLPSINAAIVDEQMRLAHKYRNALVELERARRTKVEETLVRLSPDLNSMTTSISQAEERLEALRSSIKRTNASQRTRVSPSDATRTSITDQRAELKEFRARRKELRTALFASPEWNEASKDIDLWASTEGKHLRSESGLYWGTYLHVEQSMSGARRGAPPKFHRADGSGHLAVQVQHGISIELAFSGADQRIRIARVPPEAWQLGGRRLRRTTIDFRIGTEKDGRAPIMATIPFTFHRPLPPDALIKWVHLIRRRIGTQCEWRIQFVLSRAAGWEKEDRASTGAVGIDVGWRIRDDGALRVACWRGSDGQKGELTLPPAWLSEMRKTEHIRSIRDLNFNTARDVLARWLSANKLPDWLLEASKTIGQWRAEARLASLAIRWRTARFDGDREAFDAIEAWRKRDKHLYEYEANLRDQLQRRREDIYRKFAAQLRRLYHTAAIEDLDLRDFHELPEAEQAAPDGAAREHTRDACLSFLVRALKESMAETVEVPAPDTTRRHYECGSIERWDQAELMHTCSKCGATYDQDENAAKNILDARTPSAEVTAEGAR